MHESEEFPGQFETDVCAFVDPRCKEIGVRFLCADGNFEPEEGVNILEDNMVQYKMNRMMLGLLESSELAKQFPLNVHMHHLNALSFTKGSYIGQELTQSTYDSGIIGKIAMPFSVMSQDNKIELAVDNFDPHDWLNTDFDESLVSQVILDSKGKKLGKVLAA